MNERLRQQLRKRIIRKRRFVCTNISTQIQMINISTSTSLLFSLQSSLLEMNHAFSMFIKRKPKKIWMKLHSTDFWDRIVSRTDNEEFLPSFRMKHQSFNGLCEVLTSNLLLYQSFLKRRELVSMEKQIAVTFYKLASCAEYRIVGNVFRIHKSTVKKSTHFEEVCKLPQVIGCIDGTHIPILAPSDRYRNFINRKGWTSYNMQAVVDHKFRDIFVKFLGNTRDVASSLYKHPAYPLMNWVMKDYSGTTTSQQELFNVYLTCGPVFVEMTFGQLKARWRILLKRIDVHPTFVCCLILSNITKNSL
ncbi:hypothetical protein RN001_008545 [Aquatica leii]|uniref:DDE Tnp4 domain-containing protein n=1 Tax=Aquatica leii TaxID=1421715 RepID=A0AAN7PXG4_9COLE|nr:hypothetical protein RN001_008545 [Aquatica leii]